VRVPAPAADSAPPAPAFPGPDPAGGRVPSGTPSTLHLVLRSSPPGALAAVDGTVVGPTPTYWRGAATGKPREFTFVLSGHALARYRFVPLRDGVVHATLARIVTEADAGIRSAQ
jgi:hypothetical protein